MGAILMKFTMRVTVPIGLACRYAVSSPALAWFDDFTDTPLICWIPLR